MKNTITIQDMCKRLRPILKDRVDKLFLEYSLAESKEEKHEIYQIVIALYSKHIDDRILDGNAILEPPKEGAVNGQYELGSINYHKSKRDSFGLRDKDWVRHVCISGMSGSGKTTLAIRILKNFVDSKKPFIVFDWKKSFRPLMWLSKDISVFTVGRKNASNFFRFNINHPPTGVDADEWITILTDLLCEIYGASFGVHKLLTEAMQKSFKDFGVYSGSENYPTWFQIKDRLEKMAVDAGKGHSRESEWLTSALRIAHSLTFGEFGKTINDKNRHNLTVEDILAAQSIFELDSLGVMEKKLFSSYLLLYIYKLRKAQSNGIGSDFNAAILVDEAHNIFLKEKPSFIQESVTDQIYREIREYGISLICLDQHVSKLSDTVLGNSSTNIAFQQILPQDVDSISRLMFLHDDRNIFTKLSVGQAIVKLTERAHDPFLIDVEMIKIPNKPISDQRLREIVKENCIFQKRMKLSKKMMDKDELAKELRRVAALFNDSGADSSDTESEKVENIKKDMANAIALDEKKKKTSLTNHLQQEIFDGIFERARMGMGLKDLKKSFTDEGYKATDINKAFKCFHETHSGSLLAKFMEITNHNSHSKIKTKPTDLIHFLQKLQLVDENLTTTQLYNELKISARKGNDVKNSLVEMGLVDVYESKTAKGLTKTLKFTLKGSRFMERLGI